jgi:valyl-tRNA synthetase
VDEEALAAGELLIHVLGSVRRYKAARKVSMKSKLKSLIITASQERVRLLEMARDDLRPVTQSEKLEFEESALETSMTVRIIDDGEFEEEIRLE